MTKEKINKNLREHNNRAFAVLFAILLASFLITLGISIFSISMREVQINASARDSKVAFYAADSAYDCAMYWDVKNGVFPECFNDDCSKVSINENVESYKSEFSADIKCNDSSSTLNFSKNNNAYSASGNIFMASSTASSSYANIAITKTYKSFNLGHLWITTIEADGYNTIIPGRRVEQTINETIVN